MNKPASKILTLPLRLAVIILIYGALFKVMHWPYANPLMGFGSISILLLYLIRFFYKKEKVILDYVKLVIVLLWVFKYIIGVFHIMSLPYIFEILLLVLCIWWLIEEGLDFISNRKLKGHLFLKSLYYLFFGLTTCLLVVGIIFKIQHWPYGNIMFTLGVLLLSGLLLLDYFIVKRS
ncbi:GldL-related protein [Psychroserpens algicola]|uniref:GldL-related protein n=1 Tax=Psychroserpens algicola TaxID=1719034 RepID=UPI001954EFB4|nr:hypothetical protein [Psychroserpens algicola]